MKANQNHHARPAQLLANPDGKNGLQPPTFQLMSASTESGPGKEPGVKDGDTYNNAAVTGGVPFVKGANDTHNSGIDINDVRQGDLGDCYLMGAMGAVAKANPALIQNLIKDNKDGTFDVTLYVKENWYSSRAAKVFKVTNSFPTTDGTNPAYAGTNSFTNGPADEKTELWPMLIEKAYAQFKGGYGNIASGAVDEAMQVLTGKSVDVKSTTWNSKATMLTDMRAALDNGQAVVADTAKIGDTDKSAQQKAKTAGIVGGHTYVVLDVDVSAKKIKLHNPWGFNHAEVTIDQFNALFDDYSIMAK